MGGGGEGEDEASAVLDNDGPEEAGGSDSKGDEGLAAAASSSSASSSPSSAERPHSLPAVRVLSDADIAAGTHGIEDVVLPLPGFAVVFPQHAVGAAAAARLLAEDGFGLECEGAGASVEERVAAVFRPRDRRFQFPGDYRALVGVAHEVQWATLRSPPFQDVLLSDVDEMHGRRLRAEAGAGEPTLKVSFTLGRSVYATIVLREVMGGCP